VLNLGKHHPEEWRGNWGFDLCKPEDLAGSSSDLFALTEKTAKSGAELPKLYFWCGTEDFLIKINREYKALLDSLAVDYTYKESEGDHTWKWWDLHIQDALNCLLDKEEK
jgi:S-formylglutathione hydrolase FrmB